MLVIMSQHEVFLSYFSRCEVDLRALVGAALHDFHAREEVFQEIALTLWQQFSRYDPSRPFGAWARGVAAKKLMERFSRDRRHPLVFSPEAIRKLVDAAERSDSRPAPDFEALDHCLGKLPAKSRQLLSLRYGQAQSAAVIASQTRATEPAVRQALSRLRGRLRDCMERYMATRSDSEDVV
jgi:RNA polymerase sigma-70 factor (ECF subfamily)